MVLAVFFHFFNQIQCRTGFEPIDLRFIVGMVGYDKIFAAIAVDEFQGKRARRLEFVEIQMIAPTPQNEKVWQACEESYTQ